MPPSKIPNFVLFAMAIVLAILGCSLCGVEVVALSVSLLAYLPACCVVVFGCIIAGYLISEATVPKYQECFA
jgi:hypothetical protein